jgi:hypothetical protein
LRQLAEQRDADDPDIGRPVRSAYEFLESVKVNAATSELLLRHPVI